MTQTGEVTTLGWGRAAFAEQRWADAASGLAGALDAADPEPGDLEQLAVAAYLTGDDDMSDRAWELAHARFQASGDNGAAARCAFWLGLLALLRGSDALANGWLARAGRLATGLPDSHPVRGLLAMVEAWFATLSGDIERAVDGASRAEAIGEAAGDPDVLALARLTHGEALVARGDPRQGTALLDEAMLAVTAGEVSPVATGIVYCAVIDACMTALDLRRASEWTEALRRWCDAQPDLVPYRGVCLVHRSQILQANGAWDQAEDEADRARDHLSRPPHPALGVALYQRGELHRLRGELAAADDLYRKALAHGFQPKPGLALLRLAQGRGDEALALVGRMLEETAAPLSRAPVVEATVTIALAVGEHEVAEGAAAELESLAVGAPGDVLHAMAARARGSVLLAEADAAGALVSLREAARVWARAQLPYESARTSLLIAEACRALGDVEGAAMELDVARSSLSRMGAAVAAEAGRVPGGGFRSSAGLLGDDRRSGPDGLSARECEVLRLVAQGSTNRQIGAALTISEHTVARHLQNIFTKTGRRSRAAAASYAHERGLVGPRGGDRPDGQI